MSLTSRPKTAPMGRRYTINHVAHRPNSAHSNRPYSSRSAKKQYLRSHSLATLPGSRSASRNVYRSSSDIRNFTAALLEDVLPNKFKPLHSVTNDEMEFAQETSNEMDQRPGSPMNGVTSNDHTFSPRLGFSPRKNNISNMSSPRRSDRQQSMSTMSWKHKEPSMGGHGASGGMKGFPGTSFRANNRSRRQSTLSTARTSGYKTSSTIFKSSTKSSAMSKTKTMNVRIIRTKSKLDDECDRLERKKLTPYERYAFMDEVHDLFFKLKQKEKQRQKYLVKQDKLEESVETQEMLRERLLNESLRLFQDNQHLILTRAESNWLQHTKNIKRWYMEHIREGQIKKKTMDEYYNTARSTKIKDNYVRLSKMLAKKRSKLNKHLRKLGFDQDDIGEVNRQLTDFDRMMETVCDIDMMTNNTQNKIDIIQKELVLQSLLTQQEEDSLCGMVFDLQRIHKSLGDRMDDVDHEIYDVGQSIHQIQEYCKGQPRHRNMVSPTEDSAAFSSEFENYKFMSLKR